MNLHVDDAISFSYPEGFVLRLYPLGHEYYLKRKRMTVSLNLIRDDFNWQVRWQQISDVLQMPPHDIVNSASIGIPGGRMWTEDFSRCGFQGIVRRFLHYNYKNEFSEKHLLLAVWRGSNRLEIGASDPSDFSEDTLDELLESIAFPGEERYAEARQQGPRMEAATSLYVAELKHFPKLGRAPQSGGASAMVDYTSESVTEAQRNALAVFVQNEKMLFEKVKKAVFRYYTTSVYPLFRKLTEDDALAVFQEVTGIGSELRDIVPRVTQPRQVARMIELSSIIVHKEREADVVPIGLRFHCEWDEEHGLGVRVTDDRLEAIGTDAVALVPDLFEGESGMANG